jgi:hypothetical protein
MAGEGVLKRNNSSDQGFQNFKLELDDLALDGENYEIKKRSPFKKQGKGSKGERPQYKYALKLKASRVRRAHEASVFMCGLGVALHSIFKPWAF